MSITAFMLKTERENLMENSRLRFRAWVEHQGGYINGFNMIGFSTGQGAPSPKLQRYSDEWQIEDVILEQFTGLKDKNGKDAYKSDLIDCGDVIWEVVWDDDSACWSVKSHTKTKCTIGTMFFSNIVTGGEIIGNVHENRELLEPK